MKVDYTRKEICTRKLCMTRQGPQVKYSPVHRVYRLIVQRNATEKGVKHVSRLHFAQFGAFTAHVSFPTPLRCRECSKITIFVNMRLSLVSN